MVQGLWQLVHSFNKRGPASLPGGVQNGPSRICHDNKEFTCESAQQRTRLDARSGGTSSTWGEVFVLDMSASLKAGTKYEMLVAITKWTLFQGQGRGDQVKLETRRRGVWSCHCTLM